MRKIKVWDVNGYGFVEDIKKFNPCSKYDDYIFKGVLAPGDTLVDIMENEDILNLNKCWLIVQLLCGMTSKADLDYCTCDSKFPKGCIDVYHRNSGKFVTYTSYDSYDVYMVANWVEHAMEKYEEWLDEQD